MKSQYIEPLPTPSVTLSQKTVLATLAETCQTHAEVKKCFKTDIPLSERTDWENWITRDKAEIHRLSGEITKLEAGINKQVYALFDLSDDEIKLLEANI